MSWFLARRSVTFWILSGLLASAVVVVVLVVLSVESKPRRTPSLLAVSDTTNYFPGWQERAARNRLREGTEQIDKVQTLRSTGLLRRYDKELGDAYVDPLLWAGCNVDVKTGIIMTISGDLGGGSVDVFDYQSGRKLATYSPWSGLTFY